MAQAPLAENGATAVRYEHSRGFPELLEQLGVSVLISTYQAGKVLVLGTVPSLPTPSPARGAGHIEAVHHVS